MKDVLAGELLARVLDWNPEDLARERPILQAMAAFKYDGYEQFSPGMRFVESLACWLSQFDKCDRQIAYDFVTTKLVYFSPEEMTHLVETAYPDYIRPILLKQVAKEQSFNPYHLGAIANTDEFRIRQRECLFLGLSDGARIDSFRRANRELDHEQIWQTHELSNERVAELLKNLLNWRNANAKNTFNGFRTIVLMDDFSASGSSYYMPKTNGEVGGKIARFFKSFFTDKKSEIRTLVANADFEIHILLYVATGQAIDHLKEYSKNLWGSKNIECTVQAIQLLPPNIILSRDSTENFISLIKKYYDHSVFDHHIRKGGAQDARFGYGDCGLPVVLHHNTPNNALALLWSYDKCSPRGLFPRVQRHKELT
jgi:hypothetical protein